MATMNISLPDELKQFIDEQVVERACGSSSEYLCELILKPRDVEKLRAMLMEGANSGQGRPVDDAFFAELRDSARSRNAA